MSDRKDEELEDEELEDDTEPDAAVGVIDEKELQSMVNTAVKKAVEVHFGPILKAMDDHISDMEQWWEHFDECHEEVMDNDRALAKAVGLHPSLLKAGADPAPSSKLPAAQSRPSRPVPSKLRQLIQRGTELQTELLHKGLSHRIPGLSDATDAANHRTATTDMVTSLEKSVSEAETLLEQHKNARK